MPIQRYSEQQVPLNSKIHNSLMRPNPPNAIFSDSADRLFCRGGFSHANARLFGAAISARQQDLQQLEAYKPAHSENIY